MRFCSNTKSARSAETCTTKSARSAETCSTKSARSAETCSTKAGLFKDLLNHDVITSHYELTMVRVCKSSASYFLSCFVYFKYLLMSQYRQDSGTICWEKMFFKHFAPTNGPSDGVFQRFIKT